MEIKHKGSIVSRPKSRRSRYYMDQLDPEEVWVSSTKIATLGINTI